MLKFPLDPQPYTRDLRSQPAHSGLSDGLYAYVRNENGIVWAVPDAPPIHPKILGGGQPVLYAGDLSIARGTIVELTNLSGTFQFDDPEGLLAKADQCAAQGLVVSRKAVRFFAADGSAPRILR